MLLEHEEIYQLSDYVNWWNKVTENIVSPQCNYNWKSVSRLGPRNPISPSPWWAQETLSNHIMYTKWNCFGSDQGEIVCTAWRWCGLLWKSLIQGQWLDWKDEKIKRKEINSQRMISYHKQFKASKFMAIFTEMVIILYGIWSLYHM